MVTQGYARLQQKRLAWQLQLRQRDQARSEARVAAAVNRLQQREQLELLARICLGVGQLALWLRLRALGGWKRSNERYLAMLVLCRAPPTNKRGSGVVHTDSRLKRSRTGRSTRSN